MGTCQSTCLTALCSVDFGERKDYGVGLLFRSWAWPLSSSERNCMLQHTKTFLTSMLPILWEQFEAGTVFNMNVHL